MTASPKELRYTEEHEWLRMEEDGTATVGITDFAQEHLGELVFVELPEIGTGYAARDACAVVESVKSASDVYAPVAGKVVARNEALTERPEVVNQDPYGDGWLLRLEIESPASVDALLDAEAYDLRNAETD